MKIHSASFPLILFLVWGLASCGPSDSGFEPDGDASVQPERSPEAGLTDKAPEPSPATSDTDPAEKSVAPAARTETAKVDYSTLRWQPQYKIDPDDRERLTPADVVGPDGVVYPDFRYAGIPGGIPDVPVQAKLADFGGNGADEENDLPAFNQAIEHLAQIGGGALEIGPGTFYLDAPLLIPYDGIVLRGAGPEKTTLVYRHFPEEGAIEWIYPADPDSTTLSINDYLRVHFHPFGLMEYGIRVKDKELIRLGPSGDGTHRFWITIPFHKFGHIFNEERVQVTAFARWYDGKEAELTKTIRIDPEAVRKAGSIRIPNNDAGIHFLGDRHSASSINWPLGQPAYRGDLDIHFAVRPNLKPGDGVRISARPTGPFLRAVASARKDIPRTQIFEVKAVDGKTVTLNQPLRQDFLMKDGSYGEPVYPIRNCGIENFTYRQERMLFSNGITFQEPWACWATHLRIIDPGRNPIQLGGKFTEMRNLHLREAWYRGGGGTGYFAYGDSHDCLAENIDAENLRHGPNIQWGSTGCVIRNSTFISSDAQFHMGFALENLYENCVVDAKRGTGSYGYGLFVQKPEVSIHGPGGGPRNVIYNNDFKSPKSGVYMGGSNENWIFAFNRFRVESGPGMILRDHNFDHIIHGNLFEMADQGEPVLQFEGSGHPGIEVTDNLVLGTGILSKGDSEPLLSSGNELIADPSIIAERPRPSVPSIFEWQRNIAETTDPLPSH